MDAIQDDDDFAVHDRPAPRRAAPPPADTRTPSRERVLEARFLLARLRAQSVGHQSTREKRGLSTELFKELAEEADSEQFEAQFPRHLEQMLRCAPLVLSNVAEVRDQLLSLLQIVDEQSARMILKMLVGSCADHAELREVLSLFFHIEQPEFADEDDTLEVTPASVRLR